MTNVDSRTRNTDYKTTNMRHGALEVAMFASDAGEEETMFSCFRCHGDVAAVWRTHTVESAALETSGKCM